MNIQPSIIDTLEKSGLLKVQLNNDVSHEQPALLLLSSAININQPKLKEWELLLLLQSFNGIRTDCRLFSEDLAEHISSTVWSFLLEEPLGDGKEKLQEVIDKYDSYHSWGPEINQDHRVMFCKRLRSLTQLEAAALYTAIRLWWEFRFCFIQASEKTNRKKPDDLHLGSFFCVVP